jgi:ribose 5-phosphate isomerase A
MPDRVAKQKKAAAEYAVETIIRSGMIVGLGFGSTAVHAVRMIGRLIEEGQLRSITAIACARSTEELATELGIPLIDFNPDTVIDVTIDGADEIDPQFDMIKGGGGALTREKIVAEASRREVIVIDGSKQSDILGTQWPVPIEVTPFGWQKQTSYLTSIGAKPELRMAEDGPYLTDQGNYIIDADFGPISQAAVLSGQLNSRAGIVTHGLFLNLATDVIIASEDSVTHLRREDQGSG